MTSLALLTVPDEFGHWRKCHDLYENIDNRKKCSRFSRHGINPHEPRAYWEKNNCQKAPSHENEAPSSKEPNWCHECIMRFYDLSECFESTMIRFKSHVWLVCTCLWHRQIVCTWSQKLSNIYVWLVFPSLHKKQIVCTWSNIAF